MADGRCYALKNGTLEQLAAAIGNATLPELPGWLANLIAKPSANLKAGSNNTTRIAHSPTGDIRRRLAGLIRKVVLAPTGERNATLHWAACRVGELIRAGIMPPEAAVAMLTEAGRHAGLSSSESQATAKSGIRNGNAGDSYER
jgi:hypothetical protein